MISRNCAKNSKAEKRQRSTLHACFDRSKAHSVEVAPFITLFIFSANGKVGLSKSLFYLFLNKSCN